MASYKKQKSGSIKAIVRRTANGEKIFESKTFRHKYEAIRWAIEVEDSISDGSYFLSKEGHLLENGVNPLHTLKDLLIAYEMTYSRQNKSHKSESRKITNLIVNYEEFCGTPLYQVDVAFLDKFVAKRMQAGVRNSTIRLDLFLISAAFKKAKKSEFGALINPVRQPDFNLPGPTEERDRIFLRDTDEEKEFHISLKSHPNPEFRCMVLLAMTTSLRQGNVANLRKDQINFEKKYIKIPSAKSKNKVEFYVPVTDDISKILNNYDIEKKAALDGRIQYIQSQLDDSCSPSRKYKLEKQLDRALTAKESWVAGQQLFTLSQAGLSNAWKKFRSELHKKEYLIDFRFHDLRRVAITRFFELGLTIPQVASISSHKTWRMLKNYENMQVAEKLAVEINQRISSKMSNSPK